MGLQVTSSEKKPRMFTVTLSGSLDTETHSILDKKIQYLLEEGQARLITLDMEALTFISSMGVRSIFKAEKELKSRSGALLMVNMQPPVKKVLEIINALPSMRIFASMQEMDDYLARMQNEI
jgi:anti-sigma B factor antagonist